MTQLEGTNGESPHYLRMSLAAAMTLGFKKGLFYRGARLYCINLLLTYKDGCMARCAYCGLSRKRQGSYGEKSFIRVPWPSYPLEEIIERISKQQEKIKRVCISMITRRRSVDHTAEVCEYLTSRLDIPVSLLLSPTVLTHMDLQRFKEAGADKIGIAIDLATEPLFDHYRGRGVGGPHRWGKYWKYLSNAIDIFGPGNGGAHLIVGMGETEKEMAKTIQKVHDMGGNTHLFSFYPEPGSALEDRSPPPIAQYRRIQLARYLIDQDISREDRFCYSLDGKIDSYGISNTLLEEIIESGEPFMTSGCKGRDGQVACNRPFANSRPGPYIRNFPFPPSHEDISMIRSQLGY